MRSLKQRLGEPRVIREKHQPFVPAAATRSTAALPPSRAATFFDRLTTAIEHGEKAKLKLEGIALDEGSVEHVDGMAKSRPFGDGGRRPVDAANRNLPRSVPLIAIPNNIAPPHAAHTSFPESFCRESSSTMLSRRC